MGDFTVCPLPRYVHGHRQSVCCPMLAQHQSDEAICRSSLASIPGGDPVVDVTSPITPIMALRWVAARWYVILKPRSSAKRLGTPTGH